MRFLRKSYLYYKGKEKIEKDKLSKIPEKIFNYIEDYEWNVHAEFISISYLRVSVFTFL